VILRETKSSKISAAIPAQMKCAVSWIQIELGVYSTQSGNGRRFDFPGRGIGRKRLSAWKSTMRAVEWIPRPGPR
jgi:hypothetical protein